MIELGEILTFLGVKELSLRESRKIRFAKSISDEMFDAETIGWCSDKNVEGLKELKEGVVLISEEAYRNIAFLCEGLILVPQHNPRLSFSRILQEFFVTKTVFGTIASNVQVGDNVFIDMSKVCLGSNVVIESGCVIGQYVVIGANTVIKSNTIIEDNCSIGCNCTIGGVGFGYELNEQNQYELLPHIGNVYIENGVEIGNNVCIDRAVMGSTMLSENAKVDNLVHIAHGVQIGKNSLIIANAMIAGSVVIGDNVWVAPSSSIRQKLAIGNDSMVGLGAVVVKNVEPNSIVVGNPAKEFSKK